MRKARGRALAPGCLFRGTSFSLLPRLLIMGGFALPAALVLGGADVPTLMAALSAHALIAVGATEIGRSPFCIARARTRTYVRRTARWFSGGVVMII